MVGVFLCIIGENGDPSPAPIAYFTPFFKFNLAPSGAPHTYGKTSSDI